MEKDIFTYDDIYESVLEYFDGCPSVAKTWIQKYALKDNEGNIFERSPKDMHRRLARELARVENKYSKSVSEEQIFELFDKFKYIVPHDDIMIEIGNDYRFGNIAGGYIVEVEGKADSYGAIMHIDHEHVQLIKRRICIGHDLSCLRPTGLAINNPALTSTGLLPFMERYSKSSLEVTQTDNKDISLLTLSIKHPDSEFFIDSKNDLSKIWGSRISIKLDDEFMSSVENGGSYRLKFPINSDQPLLTKEVSAADLWEKIISNAWNSSEPIVMFSDTVLHESIADCYADSGFKTVSANPFGVIPLSAYESFPIVSINLYSYVINPFTTNASFDFELLQNHIRKAVYILDDIIDLELEKIDRILEKIKNDPESDEIKLPEQRLWGKIRKKTELGRRIGLGVNGEADMLAALHISFQSDEGSSFAEKLHQFIAVNTYSASVELAKERGAFEIYDAKKEEKNPFINRLKEFNPDLYNDLVKYGRRNIACLVIAPSSDVCQFSQSSFGIDPVTVYKRVLKTDLSSHLLDDVTSDHIGVHDGILLFHKRFAKWMEINGYSTEKKYSTDELNEMVALSPYSNSLDRIHKIRMQGSLQKWVDNSISATIKLPSDVSKDFIGRLYLEAWKSGCKGCRVYRQGSRSATVLGATKNKLLQENFDRSQIVASRPKELEADVIKFQNNKEKWIAFIGLLNGRPYEIFTGLNDEDDGILLPKNVSSGKIIKAYDEDGHKHYDFQFRNRKGYKITIEGLDGKFNPEYWNYAKLISGVLRYGMPIDQVIKLVSGLSLDNETINTWKNGVERALKKYSPNDGDVKS